MNLHRVFHSDSTEDLWTSYSVGLKVGGVDFNWIGANYFILVDPGYRNAAIVRLRHNEREKYAFITSMVMTKTIRKRYFCLRLRKGSRGGQQEIC